eukprot:scaffold717_cov158-Amphora_coffeaeformis.AAC.3
MFALRKTVTRKKEAVAIVEDEKSTPSPPSSPPRTNGDHKSTLLLPPIEEWEQRPLFLEPIHGTTLLSTMNSTTAPSAGAMIHRVFEFETELFRGRALIRFRGMTDEGDDESYFTDRKRLSQIVVQGAFKKSVCARGLMQGTEYSRPLKLRPPALIDRIMKKVLRQAAPGLNMDLQSDQPHILAPLLSSFQTIRADPPGQEPSPDTWGQGLEENSAGFGPGYANQIHSAAQRRKKLANPKHVPDDFCVDTDLVYTFEHYDHTLDYQHYSLDLGMLHVNLTRVNDQPLQIMAKCQTSGAYLWAFNVWHEKLLEGQEQQPGSALPPESKEGKIVIR